MQEQLQKLQNLAKKSPTWKCDFPFTCILFVLVQYPTPISRIGELDLLIHYPERSLKEVYLNLLHGKLAKSFASWRMSRIHV